VGPDLRLPDRCLLYLLDRADVLEGDPRAQDVTQARVAEVVGAPRPHVSRAMSRMGARGLVKTAKVHVRGEPRRRLAYFLTEEGLRRSKTLRREVEEIRVVVVDLDGRETNRKLFEVPSLLPRRPRLSDLLPHVARGRIDLSRVLEHQSRLKGGKLYDVTATTPPAHFCGRAAELKHLDDFHADSRSRGLLVVGLPGIGKTALVSRWVAGLHGKTHVLWRALRPETTPDDVLRDLGNFLRAVGLPALSDHLQRPPEGGQDLSRALLVGDLAKVSAVLVFDDAHVASPGLGSLVNEILRVAAPACAVKVLLLSRERVPFISSEQLARGSIEELEVDDLASTDADAMMNAFNIAPGKRRAILEFCGGHPLSLELAAGGRLPLEGVRRTSVEWLAEEALDRLDPAARDALAFACVFGAPVPRTALGPGVRSLIRRCLLREVEGGRVDAHELIRAAVLTTLRPERLNRLHARAGDMLSESDRPEDAVRALEHYLDGRAFRFAANLAMDRGDEIIDAGLAKSFLSGLDRQSRVGPKGGIQPRLRILRGHAMFALGRWSEAVSAYEECEPSRDPRISADARLGHGKAEAQRHSPRALSLLVDARDRMERLGVLRRVAEAQYWIGGINEDGGKFGEAQDAFERGRAVAFDVGDRRFEGLCTYGLGRIQSLQHNFERAIALEEEGLQLLERGGHRLDIAKVCAGLGGNFLELGKQDDAERYLSRSATEARMTGAAGVLAVTLYNMANLRKQEGAMPTAVPLFAEALELFEMLEQYDAAARCAGWLASAEWSSGQMAEGDRHAQRALSLLGRTTEPALRARALLQLGKACLRAGRNDEAKLHLTNALAEARRANLNQLEADLEGELGALA